MARLVTVPGTGDEGVTGTLFWAPGPVGERGREESRKLQCSKWGAHGAGHTAEGGLLASGRVKLSPQGSFHRHVQEQNRTSTGAFFQRTPLFTWPLTLSITPYLQQVSTSPSWAGRAPSSSRPPPWLHCCVLVKPSACASFSPPNLDAPEGFGSLVFGKVLTYIRHLMAFCRPAH